ncbi:MAG: hypothetical protein IPG97_16715 [Microthrixaceae bacterium]|nr:hypothetical protein [Microthrixaceae bacterium]MBK6858141.1 hypothetical protein [Microthrixaceae bacterium]
MTPGRVLAELIALDWGSWGKGATVPELVSALAIDGPRPACSEVLEALISPRSSTAGRSQTPIGGATTGQ